MEVAEFEALLPLAGGLSIGLAATLLLMLSGRIAGVCGIAFGVLTELTSGAPRFSEKGTLIFSSSLFKVLSDLESI